jgi:hypothetical protein
MLVGNHSGGYALDGAMVIASTMLEMEPPRLAQGMAEKFINLLPVAVCGATAAVSSPACPRTPSAC